MFVDVEVRIKCHFFVFFPCCSDVNFAALFPFAGTLGAGAVVCAQRVSAYLPQRPTSVHMSHYLLTLLPMWV